MAPRARDTDSDRLVEAIATHVADALADLRDVRSYSEAFLTVAEAASRARCSTRTLRRALESGRLRASQPSGRGGKLLIAVQEFDRWLLGGGRSAADAAAVATHVRRRQRGEPRGTPGKISIDEIRPGASK